MSEKKVFEFIPTAAMDQVGEQGSPAVSATFTGKIVLRKPNFSERADWKCEFLDQILDMQDQCAPRDGESPLEANKRKFKWLPLIAKMVEKSKGYYESVELKRISDGEQFNSFESLSDDPGCDGILSEAAMAILNGFQPSKKS